MSFQFDSVQAFFWMEGHGPFVWSAYGLTFAGLIALVAWIRIGRKNFYKSQAQWARRECQKRKAS